MTLQRKFIKEKLEVNQFLHGKVDNEKLFTQMLNSEYKAKSNKYKKIHLKKENRGIFV